MAGDHRQRRVTPEAELKFNPPAAKAVKVEAETAVETQASLANSVEPMESQKSSESDRDSTPMSPPLMSPPPMSPPGTGDEKKRKARYKTSRALEVHYQTKKRTKTEVITQEEEEEVPASLQSGHSRRLIYITRAELIRHFETTTRPKREIAWLTVYAGALFSSQRVKSVDAAKKSKPLMEATPTLGLLPSESSNLEGEIVIDTPPVVVYEVVTKKVDIDENTDMATEPLVVAEPGENTEIGQGVVIATPVVAFTAEVVEATPAVAEVPDENEKIQGQTAGGAEVGINETEDERLRKRPHESSGSNVEVSDENAREEQAGGESDEDQVVPLAVMSSPPKRQRLVPSDPVELRPLAVVASEPGWNERNGSGNPEPYQETSISVTEVQSSPGVDWSEGNESFNSLRVSPGMDEDKQPVSTFPVEEDVTFEVQGLVMAAGPSTVDIDVAKPAHPHEKAEIQLQPVVESEMDWDDLFPPPFSDREVPLDDGSALRQQTNTTSSEMDQNQHLLPTQEGNDEPKNRFSLTEEEKAESKKQMEAIWAIAAGKDDDERSRRSRSPTRSVPEAELEAIQKTPLVRSAARLTSWEEESEMSGGRLRTAEGVEHLLATLAHIKSKYGRDAAGKDGFAFLEGMITGPEFRSAMEVWGCEVGCRIC